MKRFVLIIFLVASVLQVSAQENQKSILEGAAAEQNIKDIQNATSVTGTFRVYDNRYKGVKGTPFLWNEWAKGDLLIGKNEYINVTVKYNVYDNELLYLNGAGSKFVLSPNQVNSFVLTDSLGLNTIVLKKVQEIESIEPALANKFSIMVYEGQKSRLVLVPQKILVKADYKAAYSSGREYDQLIDSPVYFYLFGKNNVQKVKLNKRSFLKAIPANQSEIAEFIKANNINLDTEAGWVKALSFYETL